MDSAMHAKEAAQKAKNERHRTWLNAAHQPEQAPEQVAQQQIKQYMYDAAIGYARKRSLKSDDEALDQMSANGLSSARGDQVRIPEISDQLTLLSRNLDTLQGIAVHVRSSLAPVLRPGNEATGAVPAAMPTSTVIGGELAQLSLLTIEIARVLEDVLHRLEI